MSRPEIPHNWLERAGPVPKAERENENPFYMMPQGFTEIHPSEVYAKMVEVGNGFDSEVALEFSKDLREDPQELSSKLVRTQQWADFEHAQLQERL